MTTFPPIQFPNEKVSYTAPTWDQMNQLAFELAKQMNQDGQKFDRIVTLAKGGWPLTRSLVDFLEIEKVASIGVKFYQGINQRLDKPEIYQDIPVSIKDETILLFDDVADTGLSLEFTLKYLLTRGAKEVKTATLFYKPHSQLKPDYYGAETDTWIIFPYDLVEMIRILGKKWQQAGLNISKIGQRFKEMGFDSNWVDYYLNKFYQL
ncbi:MAG: phosphoribosyltransferase [Candidatus Pacebacteria bacterium]|nr:phosphoribosyltransferase [Candidatus Paceibacterota bacterium]